MAWCLSAVWSTPRRAGALADDQYETESLGSSRSDYDMRGTVASTMRPNAQASTIQPGKTVKRNLDQGDSGAGEHYAAMAQMKDLVEKYRRDVDALSGELVQAREENERVREQSRKTKKAMEKRERELEAFPHPPRP